MFKRFKRVKWLMLGIVLVLSISLLLVSCEGIETNVTSTSINETTVTPIPTATPIPEPIGFEKFMKDANITLTAKDVQYDMVNNLDKDFGLEGYAELDDYYNYGYNSDLEKDYFCMRVEPIGGNFSDSWYIYCHRNSFKELFQKLKDNSVVEVYVKCQISKYMYEDNQGNMAEARSISY